MINSELWYQQKRRLFKIYGNSHDMKIQTKVRPESPCTGIGCDLGCVSPVPNCPYSLLPHAIRIPSLRRAKLWKAPTVINLTLSRPCTRTGVEICFLKSYRRKITKRLVWPASYSIKYSDFTQKQIQVEFTCPQEAMVGPMSTHVLPLLGQLSVCHLQQPVNQESWSMLTTQNEKHMLVTK